MFDPKAANEIHRCHGRQSGPRNGVRSGLRTFEFKRGKSAILPAHRKLRTICVRFRPCTPMAAHASLLAMNGIFIGASLVAQRPALARITRAVMTENPVPSVRPDQG